jgi:hypothetical protein
MIGIRSSVCDRSAPATSVGSGPRQGTSVSSLLASSWSATGCHGSHGRFILLTRGIDCGARLGRCIADLRRTGAPDRPAVS